MSSMFFSSSSKKSNNKQSEYVVDFDRLKFVFLHILEKSSTVGLKEIPQLFEEAKVVKNKKNSTPEYITGVKKLFEDKIGELKSKENVSKDKLALIITSLYNFFDNIENDNHTTLLGDYAPLSTNKAIHNYIDACKILENNMQVNVSHTTTQHEQETSDSSVSTAQNNSLAASASATASIAEEVQALESFNLNIQTDIPFATIESDIANNDLVKEATAVIDTTSAQRIIIKFEFISNQAANEIFGSTDKNALNTYLQIPRCYPILQELYGKDATNAYCASKITSLSASAPDINFEIFPRYVPILNFLANIQKVVRTSTAKKDDKKMLWEKINEEASILKEYIENANLEPINISKLSTGNSPVKSWLKDHGAFDLYPNSYAYERYVRFNLDSFNVKDQLFFGQTLEYIINGQEQEPEIQKKSSIFSRLTKKE